MVISRIIFLFLVIVSVACANMSDNEVMMEVREIPSVTKLTELFGTGEDITEEDEDVFVDITIDDERAVLTKLYHDYDGNDWITEHQWAVSDAKSKHCHWRGITCDETTGKVVGIDLSRHNLRGTISPQFKSLSQLKTLNLHFNRLEGYLTNIYSISSLERLNLTSNNLSGNLSGDIANLKALKYMNLSSNKFDGTIPKEIGSLSNLTKLALSDNNWSGQVPESLAGLSNLKAIYMFNCPSLACPPPKRVEEFCNSIGSNCAFCGSTLTDVDE